MEIKINKEIRNFTEKVYFGLSLRQFIFSLLACIIAIVLYFIFRKHFSIEIVSWICMIGTAPFAAMGFIKYNGMNAEEFVIAFIKSEILTQKYLVFKSSNLYSIKERKEIKDEEVK